jgi:hypothetical protein
VDGRADGRQVAEFAAPLIRRDGPDPGGGLQDVVADGGRRGDAGRPGPDQVIQPVLYLLLAVGDQLLLGPEVVVDGLLSIFTSLGKGAFRTAHVGLNRQPRPEIGQRPRPGARIYDRPPVADLELGDYLIERPVRCLSPATRPWSCR